MPNSHKLLTTMRNIKKTILIFILCSGLEGCNNVTNITESVDFKKTCYLQHKAYDAELLIQIGYMQALDSLLLIANLNTDTICSFYSTHENMKKVYQYGVIGNGPNEFLQPLLTYSYHNTFGLNEVNKQELVILEIKSKEGKLVLACVPDIIKKILKTVELEDLFEVYESVDDALAAF